MYSSDTSRKTKIIIFLKIIFFSISKTIFSKRSFLKKKKFDFPNSITYFKPCVSDTRILRDRTCGFANFSSIAIQLGGIGGIAPSRRHDLARLGVISLVGGTLACFMTAAIAGLFI